MRPRVPRVLVVDDEPASAKLLADLVRRERCTPVVASGGAEALALLAAEPFDFVFLDLRMPVVDGAAVLAELQRAGRTPLLPVVVVTADDDRKVRLAALAAGAIDFLRKPIDGLEVACKLRTLLELGRLRALAAEEAARSAGAAVTVRFQKLIGELPLYVFESRLRDDGVFQPVWVAGDVERLAGLTRDEYLAGGLERVHPDDRTPLVELSDALRRGEQTTWSVRYRRQHPRLGDRWMLSVGRYDAVARTCLGAAMDVHAQHDLEEGLRSAQRTQAVGQLAGGIAHDFNNLLAVILSFGSLVRDALPDDDELRADMAEVLKAADRAGRLTRQFLAFARHQPSAKRPTELRDCLEQLEKLLAMTLGDRIEFVVTRPNEPCFVHIDPVQFDQVLVNLVVNARDAMPRGGRLEVALERVAGPRQAFAQVRVTDSGVGMDDETLRRAFEPFFSTKEPLKGTGLGLATCSAIVEDCGGTIRVESALGRGTTFLVELPCCAEPGQRTSPPPASTRGGGGELLVVEDDAALRRITCRVLERAGYVVHEAADGDAAIERLDELGPRLCAVVTDLLLPGRSGYEVAQHASEVAPGAVLLLTSGFVEAGSAPERWRSVPILWKPVAPKELVAAVRAALAAGPPRA